MSQTTDTTTDTGTDAAAQEPATTPEAPTPGDPPNAPETSDVTAAATDSATSDTGTDTSDNPSDNTGETGGESPNSEAARYRIRAREAEQRADQLAAQVDALQRAEINRLIRAQVDWSPDLMWEAGLTTDMVRADDGSIDPDRVRTAVENAGEKFGLTPRVGYTIDHSRTQADPMANIGATTDPLAAALAPKRR